ncbi:Transducin beta-like protein 3 [Porphyridium purpureum]|uniref:Transducin beta-like protein 3 n=1 Tax=Porphyridium purpureum TaxID=35688 RepID=A0A5J4YPD0_PORPP|nr:Transducin beta-like protein 3 [Porphyridium purpureum]|eukprot:POR7895..scf296_7
MGKLDISPPRDEWKGVSRVFRSDARASLRPFFTHGEPCSALLVAAEDETIRGHPESGSVSRAAWQETNAQDVSLVALPCDDAVSLIAYVKRKRKTRAPRTGAFTDYSAHMLARVCPRVEDGVVCVAMSSFAHRMVVGLSSGWCVVYQLARDYLRAAALSGDLEQEPKLRGSSGAENAEKEVHVLRSYRPWHDPSVMTVRACMSDDGTLFALGSSDGCVQVFDVSAGYAVHTFEVSKGSRICTLKFLPSNIAATALLREESASQNRSSIIFACAEDGTIIQFSVLRGERSVFRSGQKDEGMPASAMTLCFVNHSSWLVCGGRDKTLSVWDIASHKLMRTVVTNEAVDCLASLPGEQVVVVTGGESGRLTFWHCGTGSAFGSIMRLAGSPGPMTSLLALQDASALLVSMVDQTLIFMERERGHDAAAQTPVPASAPVSRSLTLAGNLDEVYDVRVSHGGDALFLATNSAQLHMFAWNYTPGALGHEQETDHPPSAEIPPRLAAGAGHEDNLLALDANAHVVVTVSRDKSLRVWRHQDHHSRNASAPKSGTSAGSAIIEPLAVARGHVESVGAVALTQKEPYFAVTGSADKTLKLWDIDARVYTAPVAIEPKKNGRANAVAGELPQLSARWTVLAHKKEVNCVAISPDRKLVCSGSQDRVVKLWAAESGDLVVEFPGHKRGIWSVAFSPGDRVVLSASGDQTVRIWSIASGTCLRTLDGHSSGVLRAVFFPRSSGAQVASCAADGVIKIWLAKDGSCVSTLDAHDARAWALTATGGTSAGIMLVSAGADGSVLTWKDVTEEEEAAQAKAEQDEALKEQYMANAARKSDWATAIATALDLNRPRKLAEILEQALRHARSRGSVNADMHTISLALFPDVPSDEEEAVLMTRLGRLVQCCVDWNSLGSTAVLAHLVLRQLLVQNAWARGHIAACVTDNERLVHEALVAYTDRHYRRICQVATQAHYFDYIASCLGSLGAGEHVDEAALFHRSDQLPQTEALATSEVTTSNDLRDAQAHDQSNSDSEIEKSDESLDSTPSRESVPVVAAPSLAARAMQNKMHARSRRTSMRDVRASPAERSSPRSALSFVPRKRRAVANKFVS